MALVCRPMALSNPLKRRTLLPARRAACIAAGRRPVLTLAAAEPQASGRQQQQEQQVPDAAPPRISSFAGKPTTDYVTDNEFNIAQVSFGAILTPLGVFLLSYGFGAYFLGLPGADIAALMLIYGFPISVLGFALSYAQLEPVPCKSSKAALALRATQMTDIQQQVREDTTRFRYGDEQHLEEALTKIFKLGRSGGVPRKQAPRLIGLREEVLDGAYTLVLEFKSTLDQARWDEFQPKIQSFFGPGIVARVELQAGNTGIADVLLIADGSGEGRGGGERKDPLMPLLPGLAPRKQ